MKTILSLPLLVLRGVGRAILSIFNVAIALLFVGGLTAAIANYTMTQGSGTTFASVVISTVHYAAGLICDATNGQANCSTVKAGNTAATTDQALVVSDPNVLAAVQFPVPGTASTNCSATGGKTGTQAAQMDQYGVFCHDNWLWAGVVLGAPTAYGTAPTGNVIGVNAAVTPFSLSHATTTGGLANNLSAKASAGNLTAFNCTAITGGVAGYCIAYNGASTPSTGSLTGTNVLDFCYFDTTARGCSLSHIYPGSVAYSSGIQILVSSASSPYTYTTGTDTAAISADYQ